MCQQCWRSGGVGGDAATLGLSGGGGGKSESANGTNADILTLAGGDERIFEEKGTLFVDVVALHLERERLLFGVNTSSFVETFQFLQLG